MSGAPGAVLVDSLIEHGIDTFSGVPCSYLRHAFAAIEGFPAAGPGPWYLPAPREDTAVGLAAGCALANRRSAVFMQNSGLGYCLNSLTSFVQVYRIPLVLVVSWRGGTPEDAVEHTVIGPNLLELLGSVGLAGEVVEKGRVQDAVETAARQAQSRREPVALVVPDGF